MKPIVDEVARRLRDELKAKIEDFEGLYIFGSQVRGDAKEGSDVDIVLLFGQDYFSMPDAYYDIMFQMGVEYFEVIDMDVHTYTREQLDFNYRFHDEVVNKGVFYGVS